MCGIAGYVECGGVRGDSERLAQMASSIAHRGPDDEGFLLVESGSGKHMDLAGGDSNVYFKDRLPQVRGSIFPHDIGLAQRRYSIIDLSPKGHQPMWSACGNACITFNGEIYNYVELREELIAAGRYFHSGSDTEVLLQGYLQWGTGVFARLNGFFAVAIYDARARSVLLARDRLGKAQFYYVRQADGSVYWASEIKALLAAGCVDRKAINVANVADFLRYGWRDRAGTFWERVEDFPPGHYSWVGGKTGWAPQSYWHMPQTRLTPTDITRDAAARRLREVLSDALRIRLRADVPVAFELSGGLDSSALVGVAAGHLGVNLTSYTIKFAEAHADEEPYARAVAARYPDKIDYRIIRPGGGDFWMEANEFVWQQEEPFHAPNLQTNQHLRRKMKADGAHVVITGSAGDELLAGYADDYLVPYFRHLLGRNDWRGFLAELRANTEVSPVRNLRGLLRSYLLSEDAGRRLGMRRSGESELLGRILSPAIMGGESRLPGRSEEKNFHGMMLANLSYRKMNYWLRSGGKSNYAIPIEARAPFLDYRVVEYCCTLPPEYLIEQGWHKNVLRRAVEDLLPQEVVWRRNKMGFPFPFREWLLVSRPLVKKNAEGIECPYVDLSALDKHYEELLRIAPLTLWRIVSVMLWWRRVIEERTVFCK